MNRWPTQRSPGRAFGALQRQARSSQAALAASIVLMCVVLTVLRANFLTVTNMGVLAQAVSVSAVVAFAQLVTIGSGGMNLSIGGIGGLAAVLVGGLMVNFRVPVVLAIVLALAAGAVCGMGNGWLIVRTQLSPFLVTLATGSVFTGIGLGLTNSNPIVNLPKMFNSLGSDSFLQLPVPFFVMLALMGLLMVFFRSVGLGRQILAFGANARASEICGVDSRRLQVALHGLSGLLAACAGILLAATLASADPEIGSNWLLPSFAAPIIGGTALAGGVVSVPGAVLGSLLLELVTDALVYLNVNAFWLQLFSGLIILLAMVLGRLREARVVAPARSAFRPEPGPARAEDGAEYVPLGFGSRRLSEGSSAELRPDEVVLELRGVTKHFGGVVALDGVSLSVRRGEVHALLGENGAGKSTLIKVIAGVHQADEGTYLLAGEQVHDISPRRAARLGVAVVHQERTLIPAFTAGENVMLNDVLGRALRFVNAAAVEQRAVKYMETVGLDISSHLPAFGLSPAQKQLLEIARALSERSSLLLLDEPTSSLSLTEIRRLMETIRVLTAHGVSVVYVTHKLEEVFEICDRVTVLRDGKNACEGLPVAGMSRDALIELMVGRVAAVPSHRPARSVTADVVLEAKGVQSEHSQVPSSFRLLRGEILGWYGLVGAGRTELARALTGADRRTGGEIVIGGQVVGARSVAGMLEQWKVGYVTENRQEEGLFLIHPVRSNIAATVWRKLRTRSRLLSIAAERAVAEKYRTLLAIRTASIQTSVSNLSGGNQQKVSIAKWLAVSPSILIFDEPTVGIDVKTKNEVHELIRDLAAGGTSLIVISSDLPEIIGLVDRILLFRQGAIVEELANSHRYDEMSEVIMRTVLGDPTYHEVRVRAGS